MDLLPDLQDLEIVAPDEMEKVMIAGEVVNDLNDPAAVPEIDRHEQVFGKQINIETSGTAVDATPQKLTNTEHLDKIRAKSVEARWGKKEEREARKKKKEQDKERKKEEKRLKREAKAEENRKKARERYWNKKAEAEAKAVEPKPKPQPASQPIPIQQQGFSYNQFATYMDNYQQARPSPKKAEPAPPKVIYKEKIVYREAVKKKVNYPSIFSHIEF